MLVVPLDEEFDRVQTICHGGAYFRFIFESALHIVLGELPKNCSPLNHAGAVSYNKGRQQRHSSGRFSLLSQTSMLPFSVNRVINKNKLYLVQCFMTGALSIREARLCKKSNAQFPYSLQIRKSSSTVSFHPPKGPHQKWTPNALAFTLPNESNGSETRLLCCTGSFSLRGMLTHASNAAKDGHAHIGAGDCASHALCPTSPASKSSLEQHRRRDGCNHSVLQKLVRSRFPSDGDVADKRPPVVHRSLETVNLTLPEKGPRRVSTSHDVVRTLRAQTDVKSALLSFEWAGKQAGYEHSPATFCALIDVLGAARDFDSLKQLTVEMERTNCVTSGTVLAALARAYCQGEMFEEALECVRKMHDLGYRPRPPQCNKLLEVLVKAGHSDKAYVMYEQMLIIGCRPDSSTFNILMNGFGKAGKLEMTGKLIKEMKDKCCEPTVVTFGVLVNVLCKAGLQDEAYALFTSNKALANVVVYNTMLHGLGKIGRIQQALKLFEEMEEKGFTPQVKTVNIVIRSLGHAKRVDDALHLFKEMTSKGLVPDLFTYNVMLRILIKVARVDEALKLLEEMTRRRCIPDIVTYGTLLCGLRDIGEVDDARKLFEQMRITGVKPNVIVYDALIGALCRGGKLDEGIRMFNEMIADGCTPDEVVCVTIFGNLLKAGRVYEAQQLFDRMDNKDVQMYLMAYNTALHGLGKSGEGERLWSLFQEMLRTGCQPDVITYNTLIAHLGKSGNVDGAYQLFFEMQVSGCSPDVVSYSTLIDVLCREGRTVQAFELFEDMNDRKIAPNVVTYGSIIKGLCRAGQFKRAHSIYKKMMDQGCLPNEIAYNTLIRGFSGSPEHVDECYVLFKEMTDKGYLSNHLTSRLLVKSLKKAGKLDEVHFVRLRSSRVRRANSSVADAL